MKPGEYVKIELSSSDVTSASAVTLSDADGNARTLATNERLLIDTLTCQLAAAVTSATLISDDDASESADSGERVAVFGPNVGVVSGGPEGLACGVGITPKLIAAVAGQVDLVGTGRIILDGSVDGIHRPSYRESLPGRS